MAKKRSMDMSTIFPTEDEAMMTLNMQNVAHMNSPKYQQESVKNHALSAAKVPRRKSETAKERMRRLVGLWRRLGERKQVFNGNDL